MSPQGGENLSCLTLVLSEPRDLRALEMTLDLSLFWVLGSQRPSGSRGNRRGQDHFLWQAPRPL